MFEGEEMQQKRVVIVGGGFAGMSCARALIRDSAIHVTLIDKNNYSNFTPLLYQVATSAMYTESVATPLRHFFEGSANIDIKMAQVNAIDLQNKIVHTEDGESYQGDFIVLALGSIVNFFNTTGAEQYSFPLYNLVDAERLRSRIIAVFEDADRNRQLIEQGILNFVIVGAGPTGIEIAGAIADMLNIALPKEFSIQILNKACVHLVDHSSHVLAPFSKESQDYAAKILRERHVLLHLGLLVNEIAPDHVLLSNGDKINTRTVIWAGGLKAAALAENEKISRGHGDRINVLPDLSLEGFPNIYALGDIANIPGPGGEALPQLASVAKQSGYWAARNILAQINEKQPTPFRYVDKGIMAMIGKNAAIAEIGKQRRELKGFMSYLAWLGVHLTLLWTARQRIGTFLAWVWDFFAHAPVFQMLDRSDSARINWGKRINVKENKDVAK